MPKVLLLLFYLALVLAGVLGTETRLLFLWPSVVLLGLAGLALVLRPKTRLASVPSDVCLAVTVLAALYFGGRALLSPVADYAREDGVVLAAALMVYGLTATLGAGTLTRRRLLTLLLLLAVANFAVGMIHFSGQWNFHVVPSFVRSFPEGRIGGFYNNPNHLAAFFSMVVFAGLGMVCFGRGSGGWRLVWAFVVISCTLGMALTVSRGGLVALMAGALVFGALSFWLVWRCQRHLAGKLFFGALVIALITGGVLWQVNEDYLRRRASQQVASADVRLPIWQAALAQHAEQPLTGAGARQFYEGGIRHRPTSLPSWLGEPEFVHNEYLQALADYGWIGLGLLLLVLGAHLEQGRRFVAWFARERFPREGRLISDKLALTVGAISALTASAAQALVEFHWHVGGLVLFGAAFLGFLANPGFEPGAVPARRWPWARTGLKAVLALSAVALLWQSVTVGRSDWQAARGALQAERGDMETALDQLRAATKLDRQSARKAQQLGEALLLAGASAASADQQRAWLEEASEQLQRAAILNPFHYLTATTLADVHMALGKPERALSEIRRALTLAPLYEEPRLALALYHHRLGQFPEAEAAYLWASRAQAANTAGAMTWQAAYRQLLVDAKSLPERSGTAP